MKDHSIQVVKMWGVWASLVSLLIVQNCSSYMYLLQHICLIQCAVKIEKVEFRALRVDEITAFVNQNDLEPHKCYVHESANDITSHFLK